MKLNGIFTAFATPFDFAGNLYKAKVFHNIQKLDAVALAGHTVCGSTGETPLLGVDERIQLMEWVREASAEGKRLIAGVGAESVRETVKLADRAAGLGYHFALAIGPFYYKVQMHRPDTQALYFRAVADQSKLPVLLYNIPQVTGYHLPPETIAELSQHPNIAGMKDSSGDLDKLRETLKLVKPGFQVLTGSGSNFWDALEMGASGAILGIANAIPYACITVWEAFRTRQHLAGRDWQDRIAVAAKLIGTKHGIPGLKHAMELNGYYGGPPRLPFVACSPEVRDEIEQVFRELRS
ncbi:MAG: dihydrodipicolinate synthase family protein [Bryobacteraceae bacterium]